MIRRTLWWIGPCAVLLAVATVDAGGWAVVTLRDAPDRLVVGEPVTLTYAVRQHGVSLLGGLEGRVEARLGRHVIVATAKALIDTGHYSATLTVPQAGPWTVTIVSGFNANLSPPLTLTAVDPGSPAPAVSSVERGRWLFEAKGCVTCHAHRGVTGESLPVGPDLSASPYPPAVVERVLAPKPASQSSDTASNMPDLALRPDERAALAAFLGASIPAKAAGVR